MYHFLILIICLLRFKFKVGSHFYIGLIILIACESFAYPKKFFPNLMLLSQLIFILIENEVACNHKSYLHYKIH